MNTPQEPIDTGFDENSTAEDVIAGIRLDGQQIIVTGGHSGIGRETTRVLSEAGATVIVGARNVDEAKKSLAGMKNVGVFELDLSEPGSVDRFAEKFNLVYRYCDVLINNAGIMATPLSRNSQGHEMQFATNHLGHFRLTGSLWKDLGGTKARVVNVSSSGHRYSGIDFEDPDFQRRPYDKWLAYGQSKTANSLFSVHLDEIGKGWGVRAFAVHPGYIAATNLKRFMSDEELAAASSAIRTNSKFGQPLIKSIPQGAATTVWAATSPQLEGMGGVYCADCNIAPLVADDSAQPNGVHRWAIDPDLAERLWELSEQLSGFKWPVETTSAIGFWLDS